MAEVETQQTVQCLEAPHRFDEQRYFSCDHIYLVGFLVCSGNKIIGTSQASGRIAFVFQKTPVLLADVARFMAGASIPARRFSFELLRLKRMLHVTPLSKLERFQNEEYEAPEVSS
jgi:hypothetical protein